MSLETSIQPPGSETGLSGKKMKPSRSRVCCPCGRLPTQAMSNESSWASTVIRRNHPPRSNHSRPSLPWPKALLPTQALGNRLVQTRF